MSASIVALTAFLAGSTLPNPPSLPIGLSGSDEKAEVQSDDTSPALPSLPTGLGTSSDADQSDKADTALPSLPSGLGSTSSAPSAPKKASADQSNWFTDNFSGFVEARAGVRLQDDPTQKDMSIGEIRAQMEGTWEVGQATVNLTTDFLFDPVADQDNLDLEKGRGAIDLREANIVLRPLDNMDLKVGRQIATWGTGDLVFINDLFPKDYNSFFIGRDDEYLKAPSDAIRASIYTKPVNIDVVYTPRFDADRYLDGTRLSYFNPLAGGLVGRNAVVDPDRPDAWFSDDEVAIRAARNIGTVEAAAYYYDGNWKSPMGLDASFRPTFPKLAVYGASARGPIAGGIGNIEFGYYDSKDDDAGNNPFVPNSQARYLVGFEREAASNLTVGLQYYAEQTLDYGALVAALPPGFQTPEETRHVITTRITKLAYNQNLILSAFNFYSPNEEDGYARARATYKVNDDWLVDGGVNVFYGKKQKFFGQFQDNTNLYVGIRRSY